MLFLSTTISLAGFDIQEFQSRFHELGVLDLPTVIRYILSVTKNPKLHYIGHSMGATAFFVTMSEIPEMNDSIGTAILYAPAAFLSNTRSYLRFFAPIAEELYVSISYSPSWLKDNSGMVL